MVPLQQWLDRYVTRCRSTNKVTGHRFYNGITQAGVGKDREGKEKGRNMLKDKNSHFSVSLHSTPGNNNYEDVISIVLTIIGYGLL